MTHQSKFDLNCKPDYLIHNLCTHSQRLAFFLPQQVIGPTQLFLIIDLFLIVSCNNIASEQNIVIRCSFVFLCFAK